MSEFRTDEETVEQLLRWWQENGTALVVAVLLVIAGVFGWDYWQTSRTAEREAAATIYQAWQRAVRNTSSETSQERAAELAAQLRSEHPASSYVAFITLEDAQRAYENEDAAGARAALEGLLELDLTPELLGLARLRLARLDYDAGEYEATLAQLDAMAGGGRLSVAEELRGDALLGLDRREEARAAYARAVAAANGVRPLLQMKLDDLGGAAESAVEASAAADGAS